MKPVSFRAETMPDALAQARDQMGPDALVLTTRKVFDGPAWQVWRNPVFEVLVMPAAGAAGQPAEQPLAAKLAQDLAEVRAALGQVASQFEPAKAQWPDPLVALHKQLLAQEVDPDLALDICGATKETLSPRALLDGAAVHEFAARHMLAQLRTAALVERSRRPQVVVLVGLTGAGKTTAAAKLAAHAQLVLGRKAALISLDTFGIGAIAQTRTLSELMGLPHALAYSADELAHAVRSQTSADLLVVDTPARNPHAAGQMAELAELLAPLPAERIVLLVASAATKTSDQLLAMQAFSALGLSGMVITHLDETAAHGGIYSLACRTDSALTYFSSGPNVPLHWEPANAAQLANLILGAAPAGSGLGVA